MKINRFALLLAGLLATLPVLVYCEPTNDVKKMTAAGDVTEAHPAPTVNAQALAGQVKGVRERFAAQRPIDGRVRPYTPEELAGLIAGTHQDLDQAIRKAQPSGTEPLLAWVNGEFQQIQGKIPPPETPGSRAADATKTVLREAQQPPQPQTVPADTANRLLDQVEKVIRRIFVLADTNDLAVEVWVGSTPTRKALFRFWPQGSANKSLSITTNGKKSQVLRGLYAYSAIAPSGKKSIDSPTTGPAATGWTSDRLDLVKDSRFFCCDFKRGYCHHVDDKKDCR